MNIFGIQAPYKALTNFDLYHLSEKLELNLRGIFMKNDLPPYPNADENAIVNFNTTGEPGSHWVCFYKNGDCKIYFDSFGGAILEEIRNYLKPPIYRNTDIVQPINTPICGHLCLYVLKALNNGMTSRDTLNSLEQVGGGI